MWYGSSRKGGTFISKASCNNSTWNSLKNQSPGVNRLSDYGQVAVSKKLQFTKGKKQGYI